MTRNDDWIWLNISDLGWTFYELKASISGQYMGERQPKVVTELQFGRGWLWTPY